MATPSHMTEKSIGGKIYQPREEARRSGSQYLNARNGIVPEAVPSAAIGDGAVGIMRKNFIGAKFRCSDIVCMIPTPINSDA
jgi:hypothetical protein